MTTCIDIPPQDNNMCVTSVASHEQHQQINNDDENFNRNRFNLKGRTTIGKSFLFLFISLTLLLVVHRVQILFLAVVVEEHIVSSANDRRELQEQQSQPSSSSASSNSIVTATNTTNKVQSQQPSSSAINNNNNNINNSITTTTNGIMNYLNDTMSPSQSYAPTVQPSIEVTAAPSLANESLLEENFRQSYCGSEINTLDEEQQTGYKFILQLKTQEYGPYGGEPLVQTESQVVNQEIIYSSESDCSDSGVRDKVSKQKEGVDEEDVTVNPIPLRELRVVFKMKWSSRNQNLFRSGYIPSFTKYMNSEIGKIGMEEKLTAVGIPVQNISDVHVYRPDPKYPSASPSSSPTAISDKIVLSPHELTYIPTPTSIVTDNSGEVISIGSAFPETTEGDTALQPSSASIPGNGGSPSDGATTQKDQTIKIVAASVVVLCIIGLSLMTYFIFYRYKKRRNSTQIEIDKQLNDLDSLEQHQQDKSNYNDQYQQRDFFEMSPHSQQQHRTSLVSDSSKSSSISTTNDDNNNTNIPQSYPASTTGSLCQVSVIDGGSDNNNNANSTLSREETLKIQQKELLRQSLPMYFFTQGGTSNISNYDIAANTDPYNNDNDMNNIHMMISSLGSQHQHHHNQSEDIDDDELDQYKDPNLESLRVEINNRLVLTNNNNDTTSGGSNIMLSRAFVRALLMDDDDVFNSQISNTSTSTSTLFCSMVMKPYNAASKSKNNVSTDNNVDNNMKAWNPLAIEANFLCITYDWMKRMEDVTIEQKNDFLQNILNEIVVCVLYQIITPIKASQILHECSAILQQQLKLSLPGTTLLIIGMRKNVKKHNVSKAMRFAGEIDELAVGTSYKCRGFGYVRYKTPEAADRALERFRVHEIVVQDVAVSVRKLLASDVISSTSSNMDSTIQQHQRKHSQQRHMMIPQNQFNHHNQNNNSIGNRQRAGTAPTIESGNDGSISINYNHSFAEDDYDDIDINNDDNTTIGEGYGSSSYDILEKSLSSAQKIIKTSSSYPRTNSISAATRTTASNNVNDNNDHNSYHRRCISEPVASPYKQQQQQQSYVDHDDIIM